MRNAGWVAVLGSVGVVGLLAGCGTVSAGRATAPVTSVAAAQQTPQQRAVADAAKLLAAFVPPPQAVRTTREPVSLLSEAPTEPASGEIVTRIGWWQGPGQPATVLGWIKAHQPSGFSDASVGKAGRLAPGRAPVPIRSSPNLPLSFVDFTVPDVPGVLVDRTVIAAVVADGRDRTAIGVYAQVLWLPPRTAAELIPAAARLVTITPLSGSAPPAATDHQVTITDRGQLTRIAAVVNALPSQPSVELVECGPNPGPGMQLTFRATAGGPALAVVTAHQQLCPEVSLVIGGKRMPELDGANTLFQRVMAIAGFHWADFPAPARPHPPPARSSSADSGLTPVDGRTSGRRVAAPPVASCRGCLRPG